MGLYTFVCGLLVLAVLRVPAVAEELLLPSDVVNVAFPEFGDSVGPESDYGLANLSPVEVVREGEADQEIHLVRTPCELRLSRLRERRYEARFQVKLGKVELVYFWLETPPLHGQWRITLSIVSADGSRETVFDRDVSTEVFHYANTPPGTTLEFRVSSVEQLLKFSKRFLFTVSPVRFSLWPGFRPTPHRSLWD
jgi:hypothetical protein